MPGAPLPPSFYGSPPPAAPTSAGHAASFGPSLADLAGVNFAYNPWSAASLLAMNAGNPVLAATSAQIASQKIPSVGVPIAPLTAKDAIATITQIAAQAANAGNLSSGQVQDLGNIAKQVVASSLTHAKAGHPIAVYNAQMLDAAHRIAIQAGYVSRYLGPAAAQAILQGANLLALPRGSGKYDATLPLVLEQTVDAIVRDPNATTADLQTFAAALLQAS
jgi:hypothetical protein